MVVGRKSTVAFILLSFHSFCFSYDLQFFSKFCNPANLESSFLYLIQIHKYLLQTAYTYVPQSFIMYTALHLCGSPKAEQTLKLRHEPSSTISLAPSISVLLMLRLLSQCDSLMPAQIHSLQVLLAVVHYGSGEMYNGVCPQESLVLNEPLPLRALCPPLP